MTLSPELTPEERKAIAALKRLASPSPGAQYEVDFVSGIPNDGGDGGDEF